MTLIPPLGSEQTDVKYDGRQPTLRSRSRWGWRACDGVASPLNPGMRALYAGRTVAATIHDSDGVSGTIPTADLAFTSTDWDGDTVREEDTLLLSAEEALIYNDPHTDRLHWDNGPLTLRYEWVHLGPGPLWSFCAESGLGAWLRLAGELDDAGGEDVHTIVWTHDNDTSAVTSVVPVAIGDRCSAICHLHADGRVQLELVRNGASAVRGDRSAALAILGVWGNGGTTCVRVNEWIDAEGEPVRGTQQWRTGFVFGGVLPRRRVLELL